MPSLLHLLLLLLLLLPISALSRRPAQLQSPDECSGRRIHILDLPPRFNSDLLSAVDALPILSDSPLSPFASNHGLGPRTHNRSHSWYRTDPLFLEPLFHRRLQEFPCLTPDHSTADALFIPYYTALAALPYLYSPPLFNSSAHHGLDLADFLSNHLKSARRFGHDHFLVAARPAWDFSQDPAVDPPLYGTSFLKLNAFINITVLTPESRPWPWQEHAVPPPTSFHPATLARLEAWLGRARRSGRPTLMLFAGGGGGGGPNIRGSIKAECENRTDLCAVVDCSDGACAHDPIRYMRPMLRARFCLQPPGDTPARRATFDGILAGCIPVFFEEAAAKTQFGWHLPPNKYGEFSVFIPKEDVVYGGKRIAEVLMGIPASEVRRMREAVLELAPGVMYRRYGSSAGLRARKDAVDLAIEGVLRRIRRRVRALEEGRDVLFAGEGDLGEEEVDMDGGD